MRGKKKRKIKIVVFFEKNDFLGCDCSIGKFDQAIQFEGYSLSKTPSLPPSIPPFIPLHSPENDQVAGYGFSLSIDDEPAAEAKAE